MKFLPKMVTVVVLLFGFVFQYDTVYSTETVDNNSDNNDNCIEPDVWYRWAPDGNGGKKLLKLDMSFGYVYTNGYDVYIFVKDVDTGDMISLGFNLNSYFSTTGSYWLPIYNDSLNDGNFDFNEYLKLNKRDNGIIQKK